eukprot:m.245116 g.245116  ORF g.245116 m.245116 type:complete len:75 (+) comp177237_c0_seq1:42-266(+)
MKPTVNPSAGSAPQLLLLLRWPNKQSNNVSRQNNRELTHHHCLRRFAATPLATHRWTGACKLQQLVCLSVWVAG